MALLLTATMVMATPIGGEMLVDHKPPADLIPGGLALVHGRLPGWYPPESPEIAQDRSDGPQPEARPPDSPKPASNTGMGTSVEQWRSLVAAYFDPEDVETALCLMGYESGGNPNAKNPSSTASGLFQLLAMWHDYFGIDPFDPEQNVSAAAQLQDLYGWSQWAPYNRGLCRGL